jgi:transcriptional regulator with GAF, ATPase, and Fis domain
MMILTLKQRIKSTASSLIESERPSPVPYKATQKEASVIVQTGEGNTDEGNLPSRGEWIYNLNRSLLRKETDEVLLEQILTSTFNLLKADSGSLLRYDHNGKLTGGYTVYAGKMVRRNADEVSTIGRRGLAKWVFDNHVPTLIENTREDSRWILGQGDAASRSAVSVPLVIEGETVGVLSLARFREKGYTDSHLAFLTAISYLLTNRADPEIDANAGDIKLDELPKAK